MISFYDFGLTKPESLKCLKSEKHERFYYEILRSDNTLLACFNVALT